LEPTAPTAPAGDSSPRLIIRFDERVAALKPSGIRAFDEAVAALRGGKKVQIGIEGCDSGADFSDGSPCARRRSTLIAMLAGSGVRDPKRALADLR
jgi:hypothetical protein